jgi:hypothetical protein
MVLPTARLPGTLKIPSGYLFLVLNIKCVFLVDYITPVRFSAARVLAIEPGYNLSLSAVCMLNGRKKSKFTTGLASC